MSNRRRTAALALLAMLTVLQVATSSVAVATSDSRVVAGPIRCC